jgi:hypothetical protein
MPSWRRKVVTTGCVVGAIGTIACHGDPVEIHPARAPETILGAALSSPLAAIIAVGDTIQLQVSATALSGAEIPVSELDSVRYALFSASDSTRATVDRLRGTVVGVSPSSGPTHVRINAFVFKDGIVSGAQSLVQVTATRIAGPLTMSVQPPSPAASVLTWGLAQNAYPTIWNPVTGLSVTNPVIRYEVRPADSLRLGVYTPTIIIPADINPANFRLTPVASPRIAVNQILPYVGEGSAMVYGSVTAYGQALRDSTVYTFTYPSSLTITTATTNLAVTAYGFQDQVMTLASGAVVTFTNGASGSMRVTYTFDHPDAATAVGGGSSGNISPLAVGASAQRAFLQPGTYKWTAMASNAGVPWDGQSVSGTLLVK